MKLPKKKKQLHFFRCRSEVNQSNAPNCCSRKLLCRLVHVKLKRIIYHMVIFA